MEGPGLAHRGREASLRNPTGFKLVPGRTERVSAWGAYPSTSGARPLEEEGARTRFRRI